MMRKYSEGTLFSIEIAERTMKAGAWLQAVGLCVAWVEIFRDVETGTRITMDLLSLCMMIALLILGGFMRTQGRLMRQASITNDEMSEVI